MAASRDTQREFFQALETNDVDKVSSLLQHDEITLDINARVGDQTPITAAITAKNIEMTSLLLKNGAKADDTLFYCIKSGSDSLVKLLCEHLKATSQESLVTALSTICTDVNFKPVSNPLMFAARENRHEIVKILIEYGATLPDLQTILDHSEEDHYEQCLACYSWHQAISSEAYLLYVSNDPIQAAIDAGKAVRKRTSMKQNHLQSDYEELIAQLDQFVTKCFAVTNSEDGISGLLWRREGETNDDKVGVVPETLYDFLGLEYKQFISSTACQQFILDQWYMKWQELSTLSFVFWTTLVVIFQPVMCLVYMLLPFEWNRLIMKTPYVRFQMHWVSRIYFVCIIVYETRSWAHVNEHWFEEDNDLNGDERINRVYDYLINSTSTSRLVFWVIYIWILGMTWREIRELSRGGLWHYLKDIFNYIDILQLFLYWSSFVCYAISIRERTDQVQDFCVSYHQLSEAPSWAKYYTLCDKFDHIITKGDTDNSSIVIDPTITDIPETDKKLLFQSDDTGLVGDVFFGVATVLSCLALLRDFVVIAFVGPLRASFGGMLSDICRFFVLFIFVWLSFALGMTQLYVTYDLIEMAHCYGDRDEQHVRECKSSPFGSLSDSLSLLFWSLFSPIAVEDLRIDTKYKMTFAVGEALYAIYMVVAVVVMLNALIAMMSNTYTRVEENSEVEWKFARTNLMVRYMKTSATLPPPFNLLPTLRMVCNWVTIPCRRTRSCCRSGYRKPKDKMGDVLELQPTTTYKALIETLVDRYVRNYVSGDKENDSDVKQELAEIVKDSFKRVESKMDVILQYIKVQEQQNPASSINPAKKHFFKI